MTTRHDKVKKLLWFNAGEKHHNVEYICAQQRKCDNIETAYKVDAVQ